MQSFPSKFTDCLERSIADNYRQSDIVSEFKLPEGVSQAV